MSWFEYSEEYLEKLEQELVVEAQGYVDSFWEQIRERKRNKQNEGRLGCRVVANREGRHLQILWYRKRWTGPKNKRVMISKTIARGRGRNTYPLARFAGFEKWERELAEMYEEDFAAIREVAAGMAKIKQGMKQAREGLEKLDMMNEGETEE